MSAAKIALLALSILALGCGAETDGPIVIRLGHVGAPGSLFDQGAQRFKELVHERLRGEVEVRVFAGSQLGEDREMLDGLRLGTLEMHAPASVLHSVEPLLGVFDLPFLVRDRAHFERLAEGEVGERIKASLLQRDLVLLAFWENGFRVITNNVRPVRTPEDLRGIKLRTPKDPARVRLFEAFGANATSLPFSEVFSALRQGVVDGQENPLSHIVASRFYEVQKYLSVSNHVYSPAYPIMSRAYFESLPERVRTVLVEVAEEVGEFQRGIGAERDIADLEFCRQHLQVVEIDRAAFEAAAVPVFEEFAAQFDQDLIDTVRREQSDGAEGQRVGETRSPR